MKLKLALIIAALLSFHEGNAQSRAKGLDSKLQQLKDLTVKQSVINLNMARFKDLVKNPPRDYAFIVMFTAMAPSRRCQICEHVYDEYMVVANSFKYGSKSDSQLFFGIVDFDEGSDIFQLMRLNTAPVIMHFPSKGKPKPSDTMDLERSGIHAEAMAKWIQDRTDIPIRIVRPPNYSGILVFTALTFLVGLFIYVRRNNLDFLYNKKWWAIGSLCFCFVMVSGQMWNQIRGPPFMHRTKNGPSFINGSSQGQFILESYIIAGLNAAVVIGMILMIEAAGGVAKPQGQGLSKALGDSKKRRFLSILGLVLVCVFFSLLLSIFRIKTQGYPYSFLFK